MPLRDELQPSSRSGHADSIEGALPHYNAEYRRRFLLPKLTAAFVATISPEADLLADIPLLRGDGVSDPVCAILARIAARLPARYAAGVIGGDRIRVVSPDVDEDDAYLRGQVLLANPLAAVDNWAHLARWFRKYVEDTRRAMLAGFASEERRHHETIDSMLRDGRASVIPPSEAFDRTRAAEVSFIFDVPVETLRAWKRRFRGRARRPQAGCPTKEPVRS